MPKEHHEEQSPHMLPPPLAKTVAKHWSFLAQSLHIQTRLCQHSWSQTKHEPSRSSGHPTPTIFIFLVVNTTVIKTKDLVAYKMVTKKLKSWWKVQSWPWPTVVISGPCRLPAWRSGRGAEPHRPHKAIPSMYYATWGPCQGWPRLVLQWHPRTRYVVAKTRCASTSRCRFPTPTLPLCTTQVVRQPT
jgi:hypothetical protein